ncbi:GxGYxYP domain-containing protein [Actinopolymorpha sp. B17G11]|uniref:GxGYxYP domain-containing protein n=1 Tax=Actinopolymorpha sp. B17G11 TaxID=3160861 RepID=UPI0032E5120D
MNDRPGMSRRQALGRAAWGAAGAAVWGATGVSQAGPAAAAAPTGTALLAPGAQQAADALYPKGVRPTRLYVIGEGALRPEERVLAGTLQGQLARRCRGGTDNDVPGIYLDVPGVGYPVWLADLAERYDIELIPVNDLWTLVDRFTSQETNGGPIDRYVLYRRAEPSINVATTVAGLTGAVAVEEALEPVAKQHGLRRVADVRGKDDRWVKETYWSRLRHDLVVEQKPDFANQLRDYATMAGALMFYDGNSDFRRSVVGDLAPDSATIGWGDASQGEDKFVSVSSQAGVRTIPADHARNLAPLSGIRHSRLSQRAPEVALAATPEVDPDTHYASFLITDGDNIQWMLGDFQSSANWFASPHRGAVDLGWGISPSLIDLAPSVMRWYYDHASAGAHRDRFVAGPSGGGYLYPSMYPRAELDLHTARLATSMRRADLHVAQIIDFDSFSDTALWSAYLQRDQIDGLIYLEYSRYDSHKGAVVWAHDKPVISARTMLWDGLDGADEASVTAELNAAERDPSSTAGYSVVMWHAWSKTVDSVKTVVDNLAPHVKVVPPDTLVKMVAAHASR